MIFGGVHWFPSLIALFVGSVMFCDGIMRLVEIQLQVRSPTEQTSAGRISLSSRISCRLISHWRKLWRSANIVRSGGTNWSSPSQRIHGMLFSSIRINYWRLRNNSLYPTSETISTVMLIIVMFPFSNCSFTCSNSLILTEFIILFGMKSINKMFGYRFIFFLTSSEIYIY